jgi:hypothetical protein
VVSSVMRAPTGVTKLEYTEGATLSSVMALLSSGTLDHYALSNNGTTGTVKITNNTVGEPIFVSVDSTFSPGILSSVSYLGDGSKEWIAGRICEAINGDSSAVVKARQSGANVIVTTKDSSSSGRTYSLSVDGEGLTLSAPSFRPGSVAFGSVEVNCKAVITFPISSTFFASGEQYDQFGNPSGGLFNKVEVFRTIGLRSTGSEGALFYLEQTLDMPSTEVLWDALTVNLGTVMDESLLFLKQYDPETDIVKSIENGTDVGGYYQGTSFIGGTGVDRFKLFNSNPDSDSLEYFTTYNYRKNGVEQGRVLRFVRCGDSLIGFCEGGILHIFKESRDKPIQYREIHAGKTLLSRGSVNSTGSSALFMGSGGVYILNGGDGNLGRLSVMDRVVSDGWTHEVRTHSGWVDSGYDSDMDCSFFLLGKSTSGSGNEMVVICHNTQASCMLEAVPYIHMDCGLHHSDLNRVVAYFVTEYGQVVMCDAGNIEGGNMGGLSGTLSGEADGGSTTTLTDTGTTFVSGCQGQYLTMLGGNNAGLSRMITGVSGAELTTDAFPYAVADGDEFVVGACPVKVRWWKPTANLEESGDDFRRMVVTSIAAKMRGITGSWTNKHPYWRVGIVRNGVLQTWSQRVDMAIDYTDANPTNMVASVKADGVDVEPYMEHWSEGTMFELTGLEVMATMTSSRRIE